MNVSHSRTSGNEKNRCRDNQEKPMLVKRHEFLTWWEKAYLPEIIRGLSVTSKHLYRNLFNFIGLPLSKDKKRAIFTTYYPEERIDFPVAYRGRPVLVMDQEGTERCVACGLCEIICPAFCIRIQPGETEAEKERYPVSFSLDMSRCVFCGFCEEVCPKEAIVMSTQCELAVYDRKHLLFEKQQLLVSKAALEKRVDYLRSIYSPSTYVSRS
jgi:NADH-quinone oxidoreductase subunit I